MWVLVHVTDSARPIVTAVPSAVRAIVAAEEGTAAPVLVAAPTELERRRHRRAHRLLSLVRR